MVVGLVRYAMLFGAFAPVAVVAQQPPAAPEERKVTVTATATVEREPERAVVLLAVESQAQTAEQAAAANATKMDAVIAALRRLGITGPAVRTVSYELQPQYSQPGRDDPQRPPVISAYRAINMVQVRVDTVARAGAIVDATLKAGANRVANLYFELRDPEAARLEAVRAAVRKAQAEAQIMAEAAGQRLGPPLQMNSGGYAIPRAYDRAVEMAMQAPAAAPTPIEPGVLSVGATVTITYRLEAR